MFDCPGSNPCATTRERSISRSSTCTPAEVVALNPPPAGEYASIAFRFQFHWRLLALESEATPGVELFFEATSSTPGVASLSNASSRQWNWNLNAIEADSTAGGGLKATTSAGVQVGGREIE